MSKRKIKIKRVAETGNDVQNSYQNFTCICYRQNTHLAPIFLVANIERKTYPVVLNIRNRLVV